MFLFLNGAIIVIAFTDIFLNPSFIVFNEVA